MRESERERGRDGRTYGWREGRREREGWKDKERGLHAERERGSDRCVVGEGSNLKTCKMGWCKREVEEVRE